MSLFLAIPIPDDVKRKIHKQLEPLRKKHPDFNWMNPEKYHITLFFFGDKYEKEFIDKQVENVTYDTKAFHLFAGHNGIFMKDNLVFYLGFLKSYPIEQLVKRIKTEMNIVDDLKFFPHLTVAKYRIPSKQQYLLIKKRFLEQTNIDAEFEVTQITLYESVIEENVPIYTQRTEFPLLSRKDD